PGNATSWTVTVRSGCASGSATTSPAAARAAARVSSQKPRSPGGAGRGERYSRSCASGMSTSISASPEAARSPLVPQRVGLLQRRREAALLGVGVARVRQHRVPAGPGRVAVVGVAAEALVALRGDRDGVAVERDTQAGTLRDRHAAVPVRHEAALDDVVPQVAVVRVGGV